RVTHVFQVLAHDGAYELLQARALVWLLFGQASNPSKDLADRPWRRTRNHSTLPPPSSVKTHLEAGRLAGADNEFQQQRHDHAGRQAAFDGLAVAQVLLGAEAAHAQYLLAGVV